MSEPLSKAELAIHVAICEGSPQDCKDWRGRCVKAAESVRKPMYEEVAKRLLQHAQDAEDHDASEQAVYIFMVAAQVVRASANSREGEQDHA